MSWRLCVGFSGAVVERAMTLLTPVLTLVLGIMVGGIIMSVMQAILSINEIAVR